MILISLFLAFLKVGLFAIGGAYSFLPLIEREAVVRYHWLSREEFLDVLGMVKIFPGAISIKYATYTGYKMAGVPGAIFANLGNISAPVLFIIVASLFYTRYKDMPSVKDAFEAIRLAIFAMIIAVAFQTVDIANLTQTRSLLIIIFSFVLFIYARLHPAILIISAGIIGIIWK
jgi:chromate transporter